MKFEAVRIHSAPEMLVEQIVGRIQAGELQPGARMPSQRELARLFEVGLGTVRESVKILNAMGYLEVVRGKGTYIARPLPDRDREDARFYQALEAVSLAQLMRTREIVECGAAREAADLADPEGVARLEEVLEALRETARDDRVFYPVDFDFHIALAEATGNEVIVEIVKLLVNKAHHYIEFMGGALKTFEPFNIDRAIETAEQVVGAVAGGDAEGAGRAMHAHLNIINYELEKEFPNRGGSPSHGDPEPGGGP